ncbi:hypothetical protein EVAR_91971_1 [Eumeta japonica]|uniref:Uncharacterized protein n=1 Tax=Eumeta variegata TaxID=151549 RepID=A0A4C2A280_EUMVA|nr:hypothetical protein EVAR_91971_1 [Eumeta japonica]
MLARLTLTLLSRSRTLSESRGMSLKKTWSWKSALFAFTGIASSSTLVYSPFNFRGFTLCRCANDSVLCSRKYV